jgi:hypothetical protein
LKSIEYFPYASYKPLIFGLVYIRIGVSIVVDEGTYFEKEYKAIVARTVLPRKRANTYFVNWIETHTEFEGD